MSDTEKNPSNSNDAQPPPPGRLPTQWALSFIGVILSLAATVASLLAGINGPLSVSIGLGGIAISLLLELLAKLHTLAQNLAAQAAENAKQFSSIDVRISRTALLLDRWQRGGDIGDFEPEVNRLIGLAQYAKQAELNPVIVGQAVRMIRRSLDELAPLENSRLQVDFSYSNLLLELMQNTKHEALCTSPADVEEVWWKLPLYQEFLEIQHNLIQAKNVKITRIFMAPSPGELLKIMQREAEYGINVRFAGTNRIQKDLQEAYVLFDGQLLHRTVPAPNKDDDNFFSENLADVEEYIAKFKRLLPFSQSLESLTEQQND